MFDWLFGKEEEAPDSFEWVSAPFDKVDLQRLKRIARVLNQRHGYDIGAGDVLCGIVHQWLETYEKDLLDGKATFKVRKNPEWRK